MIFVVVKCVVFKVMILTTLLFPKLCVLFCSMGLCWSTKPTFDEDAWENLSPTKIPFADEFIERQDVIERVREANKKMVAWELPEEKCQHDFHHYDPPVSGQYSPISVKSFDPADIECDCGHDCGHS